WSGCLARTDRRARSAKRNRGGASAARFRPSPRCSAPSAPLRPISRSRASADRESQTPRPFWGPSDLHEGEDRAGLHRHGPRAKGVAVEHVSAVSALELDGERLRERIEAGLAVEGSPDERSRKLLRERARRETARHEVKALELLARPVRHEHVKAHVAHDARQHEAPCSRRVHFAVDPERTPRRLEDAARELSAGERAGEDPRDESRRRAASLARRRVVRVEEAHDETRAEDEADAVAAAIVADAKRRPANGAGRAVARGADDALRPRARAPLHAEIARDGAHRSSGRERDARE